MTGALLRHYYETGVTVPGTMSINSFQMENYGDRLHLAMQTGDFRWQYVKIALNGNLDMGKLTPRLIYRSTLTPSGASKVFDGDGEFDEIFITGFFYN